MNMKYKRRKKLCVKLVALLIVVGTVWNFLTLGRRFTTRGERSFWTWNFNYSQESRLSVEPNPKLAFVIKLKDQSFITKEQTLEYLNITREMISAAGRRDSPDAAKSVMFLKTHKTGGSTLQNIFFRYAATRNLTVALPIYLASYMYPSLKFHSSLVLQQSNEANAPCCHFLLQHMVMDVNEVKKVMKPSALYVTILRDPVAQFSSAYKYYQLRKCMDGYSLETVNLTEYSSLNTSGCPALRMHVGNMQAFDLGLPLRYAQQDDCYIYKFIKEIDQLFDLVLITELFDESLVVLKHKLSWSLEDIRYLSQNIQVHGKKRWENLEASQRKAITEFNHADKLIYDHFRYKMINYIKHMKSIGIDFDKQLTDLRVLNRQTQELCVAGLQPAYILKKTPKTAPFAPYGFAKGYLLNSLMLKDAECRALALPELSFDKYFKGLSPFRDRRPKTWRELQNLFRIAEATRLPSFPKFCES